MNKIKTAAGLLAAAAFVFGSVVALCQESDYVTGPTAWEWPDNNFTNPIVVPTVKLYTNTVAAAASDHENRVRQGGATKGAATLQQGPRIEPRPSTSYLQADPWVQPDHPWDVNPNLPITPVPVSTNNTVFDDTRH